MPHFRRTPRARIASAGFSLLELLVVLLILALASTLIAASFNLQGESRQLKSISATLADDLRLARTRAEWSGQTSMVGFDPDTRAFVSAVGKTRNVPDRFRVEFIASDRAGPARILFHPDGSSTGGTVNIIGDQMMTRTRVDWLTGSVIQVTSEADAS